MTECSFSKPTILVDLKKCRIRIHKSTLHSIGEPDHILLLVNPKERTLAILSSDNLIHEPTKLLRSHHRIKNVLNCIAGLLFKIYLICAVIGQTINHIACMAK